MSSDEEFPEGFVKTIEDGQEVSYSNDSEEDDDDDEKMILKPGFFTAEDFNPEKNVWDDCMRKYVKRKSSSLDEVIARIREHERQKRVKLDDEDDKIAINDETIVNVKTVNNDESSEVQQEHSSEGGPEDDILASESDEPSDILKPKKKKRNKKKLEPKPEISNADVIDGQHLDYDNSALFTQMNLSRPLLKAINSMNYVHPTPIQFATIPVALIGRDIYGCAATGTGKTAAFMLPVLERLLYKAKGQKMTRVLVLLPTRELAVQVFQVSKQLSQFTKIEIALCAGGLDIKPQVQALRQIPDIIIATPGRLIDHLENTPSFSLNNIQILILDEADRILDEYFAEQMKEIMKQCSYSRQTMLFSATLNADVEDLAATALKNPVKLLLNSNTEVALNLRQEFIRIRPQREACREAILAALLSRHFQDHVVVFVQTKKQVHRLYVLLGLMGIKVAELHGNMNQPQRLEAFQKFKEATVDVLIATDVAARGLDIAGVKTVINFTMPCTLQHYIHRVGRTARAGRSGRSVSMVGEKERGLMKEVIKESKTAVKSRVIPAEILKKFSVKIENLETALGEVMKEEKERKELQSAESCIIKAEKVFEGAEEQPRKWFQTVSEKIKEKKSLKLGDKGKRKKGITPTTEDRISVDLDKAMQYRIRLAKRSQKPKKMRIINEENGIKRPFNNNKGKKQKKSAFDEELVNTSKNAVKQFRYEATAHENMERRNKYKTKPCKKFKSKSRYRRNK